MFRLSPSIFLQPAKIAKLSLLSVFPSISRSISMIQPIKKDELPYPDAPSWQNEHVSYFNHLAKTHSEVKSEESLKLLSEYRKLIIEYAKDYANGCLLGDGILTGMCMPRPSEFWDQFNLNGKELDEKRENIEKIFSPSSVSKLEL